MDRVHVNIGDRHAVTWRLLAFVRGSLQWCTRALVWLMGVVGVHAFAADANPWTISDQPEAASTAEPAAADSIREAFTRSYEHEHSKNYLQAIQALEPLLGQPGHAYLVTVRLGWLRYLHGDYDESAHWYRAAIAVAPQATEPRVGYLLPLLAQQRYDAAEKVARQVLEVDPANYYANLRLAYALRLQGRLSDAERVAKTMLKLQPADVSLLSELALVYVAQERKAEARATFEQILLLSPTNLLARQQLGLPAAPSVTPEETPLSDRRDAADLTAECTCRTRTTRIAPYYAYLDYGRESVQSYGNVWGVYGAMSAVNMLEADYEYTAMLFRDGWRLEQHDFTAMASYLQVPNLKLRLGAHAIANNDPFSNGAWTVIAGTHLYQTGRWDLGVDAYFTRYDGQPVNKRITQITPHVGLQQPVSDCLSLRMDLRGYYINTDKAVAGTDRENFYSLEARLGLEHDCWGLGLVGWTGEQAFAVRQDGFTVFNLNELHTGGYGGELRCRVTPRSQITLRMADEFFAQFPNGRDTHRLATMAMWLWTF